MKGMNLLAVCFIALLIGFGALFMKVARNGIGVQPASAVNILICNLRTTGHIASVATVVPGTAVPAQTPGPTTGTAGDICTTNSQTCVVAFMIPESGAAVPVDCSTPFKPDFYDQVVCCN